MVKSFREWFSEGESIYSDAMKEYQTLEAQIDQLEMRLIEKRQEVNQIAQMLGKPPIEGNKRVTAQIVDHAEAPMGAAARVLSGRVIAGR